MVNTVLVVCLKGVFILHVLKNENNGVTVAPRCVYGETAPKPLQQSAGRHKPAARLSSLDPSQSRVLLNLRLLHRVLSLRRGHPERRQAATLGTKLRPHTGAR